MKVARNTISDSDASDVSECSSSVSDDECDDEMELSLQYSCESE